MKRFWKHLLYSVLVIVQLITSVPVLVSADTITTDFDWSEQPEITSEAAIVIEVSTGSILYNKAAYDAFYPASTTKLMTALLAIEQCPLSDIVTCSKESINSIGWDSSRIGLVAGEKIDMENALYAILLASANEVSYAVAEHIGGTMEAFVSQMNRRAQELGCVNTQFVNPHGLDNENHYSCAYDLALIAKKAIEYTTFRRISNAYYHQIPATNLNVARNIGNTHQILRKKISYEGVFAGKTGSTSKAGNCLVTCAERDGMTLICVVLKAPDSDTVYKDTMALLDYAYNNFSLTPINNSADTTNAFPMLFDDEEALISNVYSPLTVSDTILILPKGTSQTDLTKEIHLYPSTGFVSGENIIGEVSFYYLDNYVGSANIIYHSEADVNLVPTPTPVEPEEAISTGNSLNGEDANSTDTEEPGITDLRPMIIGIIVGGIVLVAGLYLVIIEIPYRKKKRDYERKYRGY